MVAVKQDKAAEVTQRQLTTYAKTRGGPSIRVETGAVCGQN